METTGLMAASPAGPSGSAASAGSDTTSDRLLKAAIVCLDDSKAENIVTIDLAGKSAMADHMIVASGRSHRHVGAVADRLIEALKKAGCRSPRVEGMTHADWVLIDAGDVVVHVFRPEVRDFYNLERLWSPDTPHDVPQDTLKATSAERRAN